MANPIDLTKIQSLIPFQIPQYLRSEFSAYDQSSQSKIADFLTAYYAYLDQEGQVYNHAFRLQQYHDIDETIDAFVKYLWNEYLIHIPQDVLVDKRKFLKHVKAFYVTRGTKAAFKFLFRILFNESVDVYEPDFFKASDGHWGTKYGIRVSLENLWSGETVNVASLGGSTLVSANSGASAYVLDAFEFESRSNAFPSVVDLRVDPLDLALDPFVIGEDTHFIHGNTQAYITSNSGANVTAQVLPVLSITSAVNSAGLLYFQQTLDLTRSFIDEERYGGVDYRTGDRVTVMPADGDVGTEGEVVIRSTSSGYVDQIIVESGGSGYQVGDGTEFITSYLVPSWREGTGFIKGETVMGSLSGASATVFQWDAGNNQCWVSNVSGEFYVAGDTSPYLYDADVVVGQTSNMQVALSEVVHTGGSGGYGEVSRVGPLGEVISVDLKTSGSGYYLTPKAYIVSSTGSNAEIGIFGSQIGSAATVAVDDDGFGSGFGFGYGYFKNPTLLFPPKPRSYHKQVQPFLDDAPADVVEDSDGYDFYKLSKIVSGATFLVTPVVDLNYSNLTARMPASTSYLAQHASKYMRPDDQFTSSHKRLYDNYYSQEFSYVVQTHQEIDRWGKAVRKLLHPVGMAMFGEQTMLQVTENDVAFPETTENVSARLWNVDVIVSPFVTDTINSCFQTSTASGTYNFVATGVFSKAPVYLVYEQYA